MITNTMLAHGDQLGAQMNTFANLYFLAKENMQKLVFFEEFSTFRRGYQMYDVFCMESIEMISRTKGLKKLGSKLYCMQFDNKKNWVKRNKRIYNGRIYQFLDRKFHKYIMQSYSDFEKIKNLEGNVHCNSKLLSLDSKLNYDINDGFGTYQDWGKYGEEIKKVFRFKDVIQKEGDNIWNEYNFQKETVAIHFRRGDYLVMASLNLSLDYYRKAISHFKDKEVVFLVFSDDIDGVKKLNVFNDEEVVYMSSNRAEIDMYLMTKCNHNIIANSTYSFWGAYLNPNKNKIVVCPHDFVGESEGNPVYINGNYYPTDWIDIQ